ncbi:hypothetical protein PUN28_000257 [Cardiocondyla obscurior]|uniref:Secreted protein n=1 Tax=Cardiocondyla obscurior TaxID=286306 RepID=A0AAW2GYL2_9HYME
MLFNPDLNNFLSFFNFFFLLITTTVTHTRKRLMSRTKHVRGAPLMHSTHKITRIFRCTYNIAIIFHVKNI